MSSVGPNIIKEDLILLTDGSNIKSLKSGNSLIDYAEWDIDVNVGTPNFIYISPNVANERLMYGGPFGETICWLAKATGTGTGDGGWKTTFFDIDNTKMYRFSVWVKRTVYDDGRFYFGIYAYDNTDTIDAVLTAGTGTDTTNPYGYISSDPPTFTQLPDNEWVLSVFHIYPEGTTSPIDNFHEDSGRYTISNGKIGDILRDFIWKPTNTQVVHRSFLYASTVTTPRQYWCYPRVDIIDGTEPSIKDLLKGRTDSLKDLTKNNNDCLLVNGHSLSSDIVTLNGLRQYIQTPVGNNRNVNNNPITICAWVKSNTTTAKMWVDWGEDGINQRLYSGINSSGNNNMGIQSSDWSNTTIDKDWHYQVIVMDGSTAKPYDNGVHLSLEDKSYTSYSINGNLRFGGRDENNNQWDGDIGLISIYDKALTNDEILQNYNAHKSKYIS